MDSWHARKAFDGLASLNKNCFPRPVQITRKDGKITLDISVNEMPTLRGYLRCYLRCGKLLHRGIVRHAFDGTNKEYDLDWLEEWTNRLSSLLAHHAILALDQGTVLIIHLYGGPDGSVSVAITKASGPSKLVEPPRESRFPRPGKKPSPPRLK